MQPLSKVQQKAGWRQVHGGWRQRCPQARTFFRSRLLPQGLGHHLADSWRKNRLESLLRDLGKTSGNNGAVPCGIYKAKPTLGLSGGRGLGKTWSPSLTLFSVTGGQKAPGPQDSEPPPPVDQSLRRAASHRQAAWAFTMTQC